MDVASVITGELATVRDGWLHIPARIPKAQATVAVITEWPDGGPGDITDSLERVDAAAVVLAGVTTAVKSAEDDLCARLHAHGITTVVDEHAGLRVDVRAGRSYKTWNHDALTDLIGAAIAAELDTAPDIVAAVLHQLRDYTTPSRYRTGVLADIGLSVRLLVDNDLVVATATRPTLNVRGPLTGEHIGVSAAGATAALAGFTAAGVTALADAISEPIADTDSARLDDALLAYHRARHGLDTFSDLVQAAQAHVASGLLALSSPAPHPRVRVGQATKQFDHDMIAAALTPRVAAATGADPSIVAAVTAEYRRYAAITTWRTRALAGAGIDIDDVVTVTPGRARLNPASADVHATATAA